VKPSLLIIVGLAAAAVTAFLNGNVELAELLVAALILAVIAKAFGKRPNSAAGARPRFRPSTSQRGFDVLPPKGSKE
jgi:hypothetical protein